jgi:hypothetical protein
MQKTSSMRATARGLPGSIVYAIDCSQSWSETKAFSTRVDHPGRFARKKTSEAL